MVRMASHVGSLLFAGLIAGCSLFGLHRSPFDREYQSGALEVSPDGKKMLWHVITGEEIATAVREVNTGQTMLFRLGRSVPYWVYDSRHLVVEQDKADGGTALLMVDTTQPHQQPTRLTPWEGARSYVLHTGNERTDLVTFISNQRSKGEFDVYSADIKSSRVQMLLQNTGEVVQWVMDRDGTVGARVRQQDEHYILQVMRRTSQTWKSVYKWRDGDAVLPVRIDRDTGTAVLITSTTREKNGTVEVPLTGFGS